ncbi:MAG: hypothetical protein QMD04_01860 [Anaerolineales bacterium]|nr:hypothetical protein [Anaerolineales bacterium]
MPANVFIANSPSRTLIKRRAPLEQFLRIIGIDPTPSTNRNPLEQPPALSKVEGWSLTVEEFTRRSKLISTNKIISTYKAAREETMSVTEDIVRVEREIDERVKSLYGL